MILIGNTAGFLVVLVGILAGVACAILFKHPAAIFIGMGLTWIVLSLWWRRGKLQQRAADADPTALPVRVQRPSPAIFWIPMHFLAVLPLALGVGLLFMKPSTDPRSRELKTIVAMQGLNTPGSNPDVAAKVRTALLAKQYEGRSLVNPEVIVVDRAPNRLVYIRVESIEGFTKPGFEQMLADVVASAGEPSVLYAALRAKLTYGFVKTPATLQYKTMDGDALLKFLGNPPANSK
jgi:hypothetical protein